MINKELKVFDTNHNIHPDYQPFMWFNDKKGAVKLYFVSYLKEDKLWQKLAAMNMKLYAFIEGPDQAKIECPIGARVTLPHSKYNVFTSDGSEVTQSLRSEKDL